MKTKTKKKTALKKRVILKRNPERLHVLVDLGRCDGFVPDFDFAARENYRLLSTANGRTLYAIAGRSKTVHDPDKSPAELAAQKLYAEWSDFEPDKEYMLELHETKWKSAGPIEAICYTSDKWNANRKLIRYVHYFEYPTTLLIAKTPTGNQYKLKGSYRVKAEGITG